MFVWLHIILSPLSFNINLLSRLGNQPHDYHIANEAILTDVRQFLIDALPKRNTTKHKLWVHSLRRPCASLWMLFKTLLHRSVCGMSFQRDWHYFCMKYCLTWIYQSTWNVSSSKIIVQISNSNTHRVVSLYLEACNSWPGIRGDFFSGGYKLTFLALISSLMTQIYNSTKRELKHLWPWMVIKRSWATYQEIGHALFQMLKR